MQIEETYEFNIFDRTREEHNNEHVANIAKCLKTKDIGLQSDRVYRQFSLVSNMPNLKSLIRLRDRMNSKFKIHVNAYGVYINPLIKIKWVLRNVVKKYGLKNDDLITIKLCGDGTQVGKKLKLFNFGFSVINEKVDRSECI